MLSPLGCLEVIVNKHTLHEATLEQYAEILAGTECGCTDIIRSPKMVHVNTFAAQVALGVSLLQGPLQHVGYDHALHSIGPGYLWYCLHLITSVRPILSDWEGKLWTPSAKQF